MGSYTPATKPAYEPVGVRKAAAADDVFSSGIVDDAFDRFSIDADGSLRWGPGGANTDVTLFRLNGNLKANTSFYTDTELHSRLGAAAQTSVGAVGPAGESGVKFGSDADTSIYRSAANTLKTDDSFTALEHRTVNTLAVLREEQSGGQLHLARAVAAMTNPGTDIGRIYLRDGTNAGTLRLVVRAGAAGAETTILDNIPQ